MKNILLALLFAFALASVTSAQEQGSPVSPINYSQYNKFSNWQKRAEAGPVIFMFTADW